MTTAIIGRLKSPDARAVLSAASYLLELAVIAASYFGLANIALLLPATNPAATPLWPPTGVALCLVLLCGYRVWPAIFLGAFSASAFSVYGMTMASLPEAAAVGVATAAAASAGAWLINRWSNGRKTFDTPAGIAKCMAIVVVTALISSAIAWWGSRLAQELVAREFAAQELAHNVAPADLFAGSIVPWIKWWLADAAGTAILTSAILLWANTPLHQISKLGILESVIVILVAGTIGAIAGGALIGNDLAALLPYREAFGFLIFVPLAWAALRGNQRDAAAATLVFCGAAIWSVSAGSGALPAADLHRSLILSAGAFDRGADRLSHARRHGRDAAAGASRSRCHAKPFDIAAQSDAARVSQPQTAFPDLHRRRHRLCHLRARSDRTRHQLERQRAQDHRL